jgi:hypothetical protein
MKNRIIACEIVKTNYFDFLDKNGNLKEKSKYLLNLYKCLLNLNQGCFINVNTKFQDKTISFKSVDNIDVVEDKKQSYIRRDDLIQFCQWLNIRHDEFNFGYAENDKGQILIYSLSLKHKKDNNKLIVFDKNSCLQKTTETEFINAIDGSLEKLSNNKVIKNRRLFTENDSKLIIRELIKLLDNSQIENLLKAKNLQSQKEKQEKKVSA